MGLLDEANRQSGDWVPNVHQCPHRVLPCGNPFDLDEAMRAGNLRAGGGSELQADHAEKHARNIARKCNVRECPIEEATGYDIQTIISILSGSVD